MSIETVESPAAFIQERTEMWASFLEGLDIEDSDRKTLEGVIRASRENIEVFLDKKTFWEQAEKVAMLNMKSGPRAKDASVVAGEILEDMVKTFTAIAHESPALENQS